MSENLLKKIHFSSDVKKLPVEKLDALCSEIRETLIETVSKSGGHLSPNLGVVELTVALHRVFDLPQDQIVWDVGHQCYTHKLLTGRMEQFGTLRAEDGISGFPKRSESDCDAFNAGHSSTSISAAFGLLNAKALLQEPGKVIAVIGDGALTGGLSYEGLNNAGRYHKNFIVILNDNKMSISRNVGAMARYLAIIRTKPGYSRVKHNVDRVLRKTPLLGKALLNTLTKSKSAIKNAMYPSTIFEEMGFRYIGPIDGHDIPQLMQALEQAKNEDSPVLVHVCTIKGKGYTFAEKNPRGFHGTSAFDIENGEKIFSRDSFSDVFGDELVRRAKEDRRICAITAAMKLGTGLSGFAQDFKDRFFDVGIAEEHAVTFAAGLAANRMLPVFAVYSTFLQRAYDQVIHDAAIQNLKVVLAIDRAGLVGDDGETHQGIFDVSFLNAVPNVTIFSPCYFEELREDLRMAFYEAPGVVAVRYPRGIEPDMPEGFLPSGKAYAVYQGQRSATLPASALLVTYGRLFEQACKAQKILESLSIRIDILKLNQIKPIEQTAVELSCKYNTIFFFEEGMACGGVGSLWNLMLARRNYKGKYFLRAIEDRFIAQATVCRQLQLCGLDAQGMADYIRLEMFEREN